MKIPPSNYFANHHLALFLTVSLLFFRPSSAQMTPTERLNEQRRQQAEAAQRAAYERRVQSRRLPAPCVVPDSWYPLRTCRVSSSPQECSRGWNAWATFNECCAPRFGAFPQGCTDFTKEVKCWIPGSFYPDRTCMPTNNITRCSFNWGRWSTEEECCLPGRAHPAGCTPPQPCWVGAEWFPQRKCATTVDRSICSRGWGTYTSEDDCCAAGGAFTDGCGIAQDADFLGGDPIPIVRQDGELINGASGNIVNNAGGAVPPSPLPKVKIMDGHEL